MKKIKLYGTGNLGSFNFYIFDKKRETYKVLNKLFWRVFKTDWAEIRGDELDEAKPHFNIEKNADFFQYIGSKQTPVLGVFFGKKRMFIILVGPNAQRLKLNHELQKIAVMPKFIRDLSK